MSDRSEGASRRVKLIGQAQSTEAYELRDFLQRSVVAFDWIEIESDSDCQLKLWPAKHF